MILLAKEAELLLQGPVLRDLPSLEERLLRLNNCPCRCLRPRHHFST